jgi:hypothetical protein
VPRVRGRGVPHRVIGARFIHPAAAPRRGAGFLELLQLGCEPHPAKRRKIKPRIGPEYSCALRPELARNWSAASQRRFFQRGGCGVFLR